MTKLTVVSTIMRVVVGILFLAHGISKLQMGLGNVEGWFSSIGIPGGLAYAVAGLELAGGILLIAGLFTRYVSALFVIMLIGAVFMVKLSAGLLGSNEMAGYELDLILIVASLYLVVAERSPLSADHAFFKI
ncbi:DoxX family protein [Paenibacillus sp. N4]|uniref:DoxX family protein n=1 Tax=Paenibacillus vietnamensis TaxID=2590547 RepID=UPI001CD0B326|nr:DoxX family protein [Paenibacillus vietnamensis]MCA0756306.1 DoxX family protein [Paenibacillus vietnamensis]